jgi:hypothetical protein
MNAPGNTLLHYLIIALLIIRTALGMGWSNFYDFNLRKLPVFS